MDNEKQEYCSRVQLAYKLALKAHTQEYIAQQIGIKAGTIRAFKVSGRMYPQNMAKLEKWLRENGYLEPEMVPPASGVKSFPVGYDEPPLTLERAKRLLTDWMIITEMKDATDDMLWRLLRLNCEALLREMPKEKPPEP
jgi:hypothetical protein